MIFQLFFFFYKCFSRFSLKVFSAFTEQRFSNNNAAPPATGNRNKASRVRERSPRERRNEEEEVERKRRREERIREREKKEERSPSRTRRSKSPRPRRRTRVVPRYMVQIPKIALDLLVCFLPKFLHYNL